MEVISVLVCVLFAVICYKMAEKRGRNPIIGAILGALFGLLTVIGYAIVGDKE